MEQTKQNLAFVREMITQQKRLDDYPDKVADTFVVYEPATLPFGGIYHGMERFQAFYDKVRDYYDFSTFKVLSLHADGNVVFATIKTRVADTGAPLLLCERLEFEQDKLAKVYLFLLDFAPGIEPQEFLSAAADAP